MDQQVSAPRHWAVSLADRACGGAGSLTDGCVAKQTLAGLYGGRKQKPRKASSSPGWRPLQEEKKVTTENRPLSDVPFVWAVLIYFLGSMELVSRTNSVQGFHSAIFEPSSGLLRFRHKA